MGCSCEGRTGPMEDGREVDVGIYDSAEIKGVPPPKIIRKAEDKQFVSHPHLLSLMIERNDLLVIAVVPIL